MFLTKNDSPLVHAVFPYTDQHSANFASVVVKGTFNLAPGGGLALADEQEPLLKTDEYADEAGNGSLLRESDFSPVKMAADVCVVGDIVTPEEKPCTQMDAIIQVESEQRSIRAVGDRVWQNDGLSTRTSDIQPFTRIPLVFENAYGGCEPQKEGQMPEYFSANPVGKGFIGKRGDVDGVALPNLENPHHLIQSPNDQPQPWCPGMVNRAWASRAQYAGTCDDRWQQHRMPLLPEDFDNRFYNAAPPGFTFPLLRGDELISLQGFSAEGPMNFQLPKWNIKIRYCIKNEIKTLYANLDTLTILSNQKQLLVNWRACIPCGLDLLYIKWLEIKAVYK